MSQGAVNEFGVPLHACNGHRQDEHYWAWLKSIRTHKNQDAGRQLYGLSWSRMAPRHQSAFLRGFEQALSRFVAQVDEDMYRAAVGNN